MAEEGETYNGQEVVQGANVFRIVQNGSNVGIILDCQTEEAAKVAYAQILASCKENGGVNISVVGQPQTGGTMTFEKGIHYSDDR